MKGRVVFAHMGFFSAINISVFINR